MTKKTHLNAYVVSTIGKDGSEKEIWTRVGTLFPFKESEGYHLNITPGLSVSGQIVIRPPKADDNQQ